MRRRTGYALEMVLVVWVLSAVAVGAAPQVSVTLDPTRPGPRPYPVWTDYPFELSANGSYTLDEATAKLVSAGQAAVSTSYAWTYAPAQLVLAAPDAAWAQFLYDEKYAETDQALSVAYTVTVTFSEALDRAPDETTATATLAIDVVGTDGGGLRQDPQDAELFVVPAAQNAEVCDRVEVRVKVYKPDSFGSFWWRRPGQDWGELMGAKVDETPDYNEYMYSWVSQMDKNVAMDWKATSLRLVMDPPPGHFDTLETDVETWTPNNTVVTGSGKVLTWDPEDEENCDTEATFDLSHLDYEDPVHGDPDWDVTVKIYNAAGSLVKTIVEEGGFDNNATNTVTWDGMADPIPPADPAQAPKGLYTYTVEAVHDVPILVECRDTDKAATPTLSVTNVAKVDLDRDTLTLTLDVSYQVAGGSADDGEIRIFDNNLAQVGDPWEIDNDPQTGYVPATGTERVELILEPEQFGTFTAVFSARQTAAAGEANRDEQPKALRQGQGSLYEGFVDLFAEDLYLNWVPDSEEDDPGAFVHFNVDNDDDSNNLVPNPPAAVFTPPIIYAGKYPGADYAQDQLDGDVEDDVVKALLTIEPLPTTGKARLVRGGESLRAWYATRVEGHVVMAVVEFDANHRRTWDLADAEEREEFQEMKGSLYVEGRGAGTTTLALQLLDAQDTLLAQDTVTYNFINADCGNQPTSADLTYSIGMQWYSQRGYWEQICPNLSRCEWSILAPWPAPTTQNCIGYVVGENAYYVKANAGAGQISIDWVWGNRDGVCTWDEIVAFFEDSDVLEQKSHRDGDVFNVSLVQDIDHCDVVYWGWDWHMEGQFHAARKRDCCGTGKWVMLAGKDGGGDLIEHVWDQPMGAPGQNGGYFVLGERP